MQKFREEARVVCQEHVVGGMFRLRLHSPRIAESARPGQFVMLRVREGNDPMLRRPFSFNRIHARDGAFDILYKVVGRGTQLLSQLLPDSPVSLIGPLGNGFELPVDRTLPLAIIAGGIGIAPLEELLAQLASGRTPAQLLNIHLFYGARTVSELLPEKSVGAWGIPVHFATDDGTMGFSGHITRFFAEFMERGGIEPVEVYSCGPLAMQYHVAKWALAKDVLTQLSLESLMACGIGACLGCALPATDPQAPEAVRFVHVCEDGPIFSAGSIQWNRILTQQTSPPSYLFS